MARQPYTPPVPDLVGPLNPPVARHYDEIADAVGGDDAMPAPPYAAQSFTNKHGKKVLRLRFETFDALEKYFIEELIGTGMMTGSSSKVIGTTLLIWDRDKGDAT